MFFADNIFLLFCHSGVLNVAVSPHDSHFRCAGLVITYVISPCAFRTNTFKTLYSRGKDGNMNSVFNMTSKDIC